jgi:hypothetical protein
VTNVATRFDLFLKGIEIVAELRTAATAHDSQAVASRAPGFSAKRRAGSLQRRST